MFTLCYDAFSLVIEMPNVQNYIEFMVYSSECVLCVDVWPHVLSSQAKHCQYLP